MTRAVKTIEQPPLPVTGVKDVTLAPVGSDPALAMIERACSDSAFDVAKLQALMDMREREMTRVAKQAFNTAMADAQTEMRPVATDADNPQTSSRYASYAALDRALRPIYTAHRFGLSFNTGETPLEAHVRVLCDVSHAGGFSKTYHIDMPADGKGARGGDVMSKTHATGSAVSYGMRYLLKMIFNVAIGEFDDDGNAAGRRQQARREPDPAPVAPEKFQDWYDDTDAMIQAGGTWEQFKAAWNPDHVAPFRQHLAKVKPGKGDEWKRKAKAHSRPAAKAS